MNEKKWNDSRAPLDLLWYLIRYKVKRDDLPVLPLLSTKPQEHFRFGYGDREQTPQPISYDRHPLATQRRLRLLACAVAASAKQHFASSVVEKAYTVALLAADHKVSESIWTATQNAIDKEYTDHLAFIPTVSWASGHGVRSCLMESGKACERLYDSEVYRPEPKLWAIREVFGNLPFRNTHRMSVELAPETIKKHHDGAVYKMALNIYEEQTWDFLPILADALEDAYYQNQELLKHLRGPGPHCRGCWALDLILRRV